MGPVDGHYGPAGDFTVGFEQFNADIDSAPFFVGLPDDRCQSPHWGYLMAGEITFRFVDHDETYRAGDAYYAPPGHTTLIKAGTEGVEFSPSGLYEQTMAVVAKNLEKLGMPA